MRQVKKLSKNLLIENREQIKDSLRRAVQHALLTHKRAGNPVAVWKDGKLVILAPEEISVEEPTGESGVWSLESGV